MLSDNAIQQAARYSRMSADEIRALGDENHPQLSTEDLGNLHMGDKLIIWWAGGNGPHRYTVWSVNGSLVTVEPGSNTLSFVGKERPHTLAWRELNAH